jgi:hypothetical protein
MGQSDNKKTPKTLAAHVTYSFFEALNPRIVIFDQTSRKASFLEGIIQYTVHRPKILERGWAGD